jgi:hypothetical protein
MLHVKDTNSKLIGKYSVVYKAGTGELYVLRHMLSSIPALTVNTFSKLSSYRWRREEDSALTEILLDFQKYQHNFAEYQPKKINLVRNGFQNHSTLSHSSNTKKSSTKNSFRPSFNNTIEAQTNSRQQCSKTQKENTTYDSPENILIRIQKNVSSLNLNDNTQSINVLNEPPLHSTPTSPVCCATLLYGCL